MQCRKGGGWGFMGKADMGSKVVRSEGLGLKRECKLCAKIYYKLHTVLSYLVCYPLYILYHSCLVSMPVNCPGNICSCLMCIVAIL